MNKKEIKIIRGLLLVFIVALALSGLSAIPIEAELSALVKIFKEGNPLHQWLVKVLTAYVQVKQQYNFLMYGYDWLAFAHFMLAILFAGPLVDPVKNIWVIQFGLIACVLIIPFALIAGYYRGIPFWWRLGDCSFGIIGFGVLWPCYRMLRAKRGQSEMEKIFAQG